MVVTNTDELKAGTVSSYDRESELKAFDDSKAGVQGLIENGVTKVPRMFYCGQSNLNYGSTTESYSEFSIPIIDLTGIHDDPILRDDVVKKVQYACENLGFFQVINHGIPIHVLDEMIKGTCRFHQQDVRDQIGGLQVLNDKKWIDVTPIHGALVVNIGDLLQLLSNDKFISVQHRVVAKHIGPRISVACLFRTDDEAIVYGPIKELLSEECPPVYRNVSSKEYTAHYYAKGVGSWNFHIIMLQVVIMNNLHETLNGKPAFSL